MTTPNPTRQTVLFDKLRPPPPPDVACALTVDVLQAPGVAAILRRQDLPRDELVQRLEAVGVHVDPVPDLLLEERLHPVDDRVDQRRDVDHVHLLQLDRVGLLDAHEELLDDRRRELGEVVRGGDARVQHVDVAGDPDLLGGQADVADHQDELHAVGDGRVKDGLVEAAHADHPLAVRGQARQRGNVAGRSRGLGIYFIRKAPATRT